MKTKNYRKTLTACYLGFITQAISANFAPLLFLTFQREYGIALSRVALISSVFYLTQLLVDLVCTRLADRIGYRTSVVLSELTSAVGLAGLAFVPPFFADPFDGILLCVVIYAVGSGLIEVLVSPIVEACPFENKEATMSLLHSFYCWGSLGVIVGSTLFFAVFGTEHWRVLACIWALIPLYNVYNFAVCPIERLVEEGSGMSVTELLRNKLFWLLVLLMVCAGASEMAMAQWASAFAESALGISKTAGDLAGAGMFAATMGISRVLYGKFGERWKLTDFMVFSGALCVLCYLLASLSGIAVLSLIGCALCGFSVGIMWPGSISISASALPTGGTALFALLALAGDLGGSAGPALVAAVSECFGGDLKAGLLAAICFPLLLVSGVLILRKRNAKP